MAIKLDAEILASLRELNTKEEPQFVRDFFVLFLKTAPARIEAINKAVNDKNARALYQEAHALRSSCASVGANDLMKVCGQLEQMGKDNSLNDSSTVFEKLKVEYAEAQKDISALPELKAA